MERNRTPKPLKLYAIYLYYCSRSLRLASKCLEPLIKRSHVAIWKWIQSIDINIFNVKKKDIKAIMIDETMITVNGEDYWLWVAYAYIKKYLLMHISKERTLLICYNFIKKLRKLYGRKVIYTDDARWYHQVCRWLRLKHIVYGIDGKNVMERAIQYIKDRTECFDDNFPCMKDNCNREHITKWFRLFISYLNVKIDLSRFLLLDGG